MFHKPLKIGIVLRNDYSEEVGGGFSYYSTLIEAIDKKNDWKNIEFMFVYFTYSSKVDPAPKNHTFQKPLLIIDLSKSSKVHHKKFSLYYRLRIIPFFKKKAEQKIQFIKNFLYPNYVREELSKNEIDILYYPTPASCEWNFPYVCTNWDIGHQSMFPFPEVAMNGIYESREKYFSNVVKKAFAIFCESEAGKSELVKYQNINPERIFVIPAFPGNVIKEQVGETKQLEILNSFFLEKNKFFFYPAQFWSHKNHYNLIIAFKKLSEIHPDVKLVFTGSDKGNLSYIKEEIARLSLENLVDYLGFVNKQELYTLYNNCIAMVMPTFLGPTNLPLLEASFLGCPVIASDLAGHREMLGDYATYINPSDPNDIFQAMLKEMKRENHKSSPFINPKFNIDACLNAIQESFLKLYFIRRTFGFNFNQY
jgi:glycosyltransferase involved in cell wall biosynthesis